ncbi:uncharacterized protein LOC131940653 [Physella acuta]|uniref:uncharacterized protein LOC131940653 n=1 Tax=Physella acuta TaxID=109671 RepID=UPI0027DD70A7|nr:uncharacterized protein LOC131940653 [Physella acuta]
MFSMCCFCFKKRKSADVYTVDGVSYTRRDQLGENQAGRGSGSNPTRTTREAQTQTIENYAQWSKPSDIRLNSSSVDIINSQYEEHMYQSYLQFWNNYRKSRPANRHRPRRPRPRKPDQVHIDAKNVVISGQLYTGNYERNLPGVYVLKDNKGSRETVV